MNHHGIDKVFEGIVATVAMLGIVGWAVFGVAVILHYFT